MANVDNACLEFSQDGGEVWGDVSAITLDENSVPVPGGEYVQGDFLARNSCAATAILQVYAGAWQVSAGGSGIWRAELGGAAGSPVTLAGPSQESDWGVLINEIPAPTDQMIPIKLFLGIPAAETRQNYSINPDWALTLEAVDPVVVPGAPSGLQVRPGSPTTTDRVTVTGNAEPGSTVEVTVDGQGRCTTTATVEGTFSCDVGTLGRGTHQISATAGNSAGTSAAAVDVEVSVRNAGPTGWGSLGDFLNWGSLGGLGSLGSSDSGSSGSAGSAQGSIESGSLGSLGSASGSAGSDSGSGGRGGDYAAGGAGTATAGGAAGTAPGAGAGAGQPSNAGGHGTTSGTGETSGAPASAGVTGAGGAGESNGVGTGGAAAVGGTTGGTTGGPAPGTVSGGTAGGQTANGHAAGQQPAAGAGTGQVSAETLGVGSSAPGQSAKRPLGSVDGLLHLGSSTMRAGQ